MKNKPYQRGVDEPITKENPYLHSEPKQPKNNVLVYVIMQNGDKIKNFGNNRKSTTKRRNKHSRLYQRFMK